jgi:hypothetical protein
MKRPIQLCLTRTQNPLRKPRGEAFHDIGKTFNWLQAPVLADCVVSESEFGILLTKPGWFDMFIPWTNVDAYFTEETDVGEGTTAATSSPVPVQKKALR